MTPSVWRLREQAPKTANAIRTVDVPQEFAEILSAYISGKNGYLFKTCVGRPLGQRNVLRVLHTLVVDSISSVASERRHYVVLACQSL